MGFAGKIVKHSETFSYIESCENAIDECLTNNTFSGYGQAKIQFEPNLPLSQIFSCQICKNGKIPFAFMDLTTATK